MLPVLKRLMIVLTMLYAGCAQYGQLSGGKRDTDPPRLLESLPANKTTGFNSDQVVLKFDEFIQVKELSKQLIISPRLKTTPEITTEGKDLVIRLKKEELRPNTTYRFSFGRAIADMHESNSIDDFEFIFSTGTFIDSLKIKGTVTDAFNDRPASEALVCLYPANSGDSIIYKEPPDYFTRSNAGGEFGFSHLPASSFRIFAIADNNKNGLYDGETEKVAFIKEKLTIRHDTITALRLFQEIPAKTFIKKNYSPYYGLANIVLNRKAIARVTTRAALQAADITETWPGREKDTIAVFYKNIKDTLKLLVEYDSGKNDTVNVLIPREGIKKKQRTIQVSTINNTLPGAERILVSFLTWMDTSKINYRRIRLINKDDSLKRENPVSGVWKGVSSFAMGANLPQGKNFVLKIDTGAFSDLKGTVNDSIIYNFRSPSSLDFGKVTLKMLLNKKQPHIIQLINEQQAVIASKNISPSLSSSNAESIDFTGVPPGTYLVKIIFDDNGNGKWDTGNLLAGKQPEKAIINSKQLKVLADWDIEEEISIKD